MQGHPGVFDLFDTAHRVAGLNEQMAIRPNYGWDYSSADERFFVPYRDSMVQSLSREHGALKTLRPPTLRGGNGTWLYPCANVALSTTAVRRTLCRVLIQLQAEKRARLLRSRVPCKEKTSDCEYIFLRVKPRNWGATQ